MFKIRNLHYYTTAVLNSAFSFTVWFSAECKTTQFFSRGLLFCAAHPGPDRKSNEELPDKIPTLAAAGCQGFLERKTLQVL